MSQKPSAADMQLAPHIKECFTKQGGRDINPDNVARYIKSNVTGYASLPEPEIRDSVLRMIAFWKSKHSKAKAPAPPPAPAASKGNDSSDEFEEQQRRGEGPAMMNVPDNNLMNQQLRASMAAKSGAGATRAAAVEAAAAAASSSKKRKAQEAAASPSGRRRRKREKGKLRSGDGHNRGGGSERSDDGTQSSSQFEAADRPTARLRDMGGVEPSLQAIRELIEWPLAHPEVYGHLGVDAPRGILLHGPPGCGKTLLANAIAGELGVPFFKLSATEVVAGTSGESERLIRSLFEQAKANAPALLFIDEVDAITPKRENAQREMEKRIVAQLLTSMDELNPEQRAPNSKPTDTDAVDGRDGHEGAEGGAGSQSTDTGGAGAGGDGESGSASGDEDEKEHGTADFPKNVIVIGATNRPDAIDPALRRAGRFDREIALGIPDEAARGRILETLARGLRVSSDVSWAKLARSTPGFVGADLKALTREAATLAIKRIFGDLGKKQETEAAQPSLSGGEGVSGEPESVALLAGVGEQMLSASELSPLSIEAHDFEGALEHVQPSSQREGFATIPDVSFDDVGALTDVRAELEMAIVQPVLQPEKFAAFGLTPNAGVLLYGPPGCGKTLVAKAIAHHAKVNFISIKGPELLNKYVGESERAVRQVFSRGRASAPCVIFFDELDALVPKRSGEGTSSSERVVNQLLTELDGADPRQNVFIIAATNRPDLIDPAMLRPGRLDKLLYVPFPGIEERKDILRALTSKMPLSSSVDLGAVAADRRTEGFSGADLAGLTREAAVRALQESMQKEVDDAAAVAGGAAASTAVGASIEPRHFECALGNTFPSVSARDRRAYAGLKKKLGRYVMILAVCRALPRSCGHANYTALREPPVWLLLTTRCPCGCCCWLGCAGHTSELSRQQMTTIGKKTAKKMPIKLQSSPSRR
eukprot:COSAG02_NODE_5145_length_4593_cov_2.615487_1_plen_934_part_00